MISATNETFQRKRAWSLQEIAEQTGLSLPYLRLRAGKELKVTRFGKVIRVLDEDLESFLKNGVKSSTASA